MEGRYFLGLLVLVTTMSIGCGSGSGTHLDVPPGQLAVFPPALQFGKVAVGRKATKTGTLKAGNARIVVTSADWNGEGYSISGVAFPVTVEAGQSVSFDVTFTPQKNGSSSGEISFLSNATNSPHTTSVSANGTRAGEHSVTLSWRPAKTNPIGYYVYRAAKPEGPYSKITSSAQPKASFTDGSVQSGQTYFYFTTALDKPGKESKPSNKVQVTIPNS
jgi:Abnormal spindle-like microcephaly-assoc'd, ASPM-SPD-2-Hydin